MHSQEQSLSSLFRTISLVVIATLVMMLAMAPAWAQNSVPPTAVQAARMPEFASRLAHPVKRPGPPTSPALARARMHRGPLDSNDIYDNGPINGNTDAWTINFGFIVSDSFNVVNNNSSITGMSFGAWLFAGDTLTSAEVSITSGENGGTSYFDQTVNFTQGTCTVNQYGYNICTEPTSFNAPNLNAGTYWVNLQNATVPSGDPIYWDENSGVGCTGSGCPSLASDSSIGTIPSEAFTILGYTTTSTSSTYPSNSCIPEQDGNFSVIHDFNGTDGYFPSGVAIDGAGNLYGPVRSGDGNGIYKLAEGFNWALSTLYYFIGGIGGGDPQAVIVGQNGILYGSASGGMQNFGLIFGLRPPPTACLTGSCSWVEKAVYSFTGSTDAQQGNGLVFDQAGNLYGVSPSGGALKAGAVFELTPSIGGWVESILYSFNGVSDGGTPIDVLVGNDGNLYGMTKWGGAYNYGVVFQLTPSGNSWTESVLYDIPTEGFQGGPNPHSLLQDSAGNLFGIYEYSPCCEGNTYGLIFMLTPSNGQWVFTELYHGNEGLDGDDVFPNMTLDASGNLFGTGAAFAGCMNGVGYAYIFELTRGNGGWQYSNPEFWSYTSWAPSGALALDTHGNLYGTDRYCGAYRSGSVWKLSP